LVDGYRNLPEDETVSWNMVEIRFVLFFYYFFESGDTAILSNIYSEDIIGRTTEDEAV